MTNFGITIRQATVADLVRVNQIIDDAIMTWALPERVKRLSLASYHYQSHDLDMLQMAVAETSNSKLVGIAAWEKAEAKDTPDGANALLLHGIYVDPEYQQQGIGNKLLKAAERAAREQDYDGLLVKAQPSAAGFFQAQGLTQVKVENENRDYTHRYWKPTKGMRIR